MSKSDLLTISLWFHMHFPLIEGHRKRSKKFDIALYVKDLENSYMLLGFQKVSSSCGQATLINE
jgi:hypothetical protein